MYPWSCIDTTLTYIMNTYELYSCTCTLAGRHQWRLSPYFTSCIADTNKMPKTDKLQTYNPATQRVHAPYTLPVQEVPSSDIVSYLHSGRRMAQPRGCPDEL